MNKATERYNTKVEIPISIILETIFSDDNRDVETLSRWAKKYGFVDLIRKEDKKYYQLQKDYTKQSFYVLLDKEERKQYDYEDYLIDENEKLQQENKQLKENIDKIIEYLNKLQEDFNNRAIDTSNLRVFESCIKGVTKILEIKEILKGEE